MRYWVDLLKYVGSSAARLTATLSMAPAHSEVFVFEWGSTNTAWHNAVHLGVRFFYMCTPKLIPNVNFGWEFYVKYSRAVHYHMILHRCYFMSPEAMWYPSNHQVLWLELVVCSNSKLFCTLCKKTYEKFYRNMGSIAWGRAWEWGYHVHLVIIHTLFCTYQLFVCP